jgi:hypothetical protein
MPRYRPSSPTITPLLRERTSVAPMIAICSSGIYVMSVLRGKSCQQVLHTRAFLSRSRICFCRAKALSPATQVAVGVASTKSMDVSNGRRMQGIICRESGRSLTCRTLDLIFPEREGEREKEFSARVVE